MSRVNSIRVLTAGASALVLTALALPASAQTVVVVGKPQGSAPGAVGNTALTGTVNLGTNGQLIFNHNDNSEDGYEVLNSVVISGSTGSRIDLLAGHTVFTQKAPTVGPNNAQGATVINTTPVGKGFGGLIDVHDGATLELAQYFDLKAVWTGGTYPTSGGNVAQQTNDFNAANGIGNLTVEKGGRLTGQGDIGALSGAGTVTIAGTVSPHGFPERGGQYNGPNGLMHVWNSTGKLVFTSTSVFEVDVNLNLKNDAYAIDSIVSRSATTVEDGAQLRVRIAPASGPTDYQLGRKLFFLNMGTDVAYGANHYIFVFDASQGKVPSGMGVNAYKEIGTDPAPKVGDVMVVDGFKYIYNGGTLKLDRKELKGDFTFTADSQTQLSRYLGLKMGDSYSDVANVTKVGTLAPVRSGLYLEIVQTRDFAEDAKTLNGKSVANALQAVADSNPIYSRVANLQDGDPALERISPFFDALSGQIHAGVRGLLAQDAYSTQRSISRRLSDYEPGGVHVWAEARGGRDQLDGGGDIAKLKEDGYGALAGVDVALSGPWRLGFAGGYRKVDVDGPDAFTGVAEFDQWSGSVYTAGAWGRLRAQAGIGFSAASIQTDRRVALVGVVDQRLTADYNGSVFNAFGELGYTMPLGGAELEPFLGYNLVRADTEEAKEKAVQSTDADAGDTALTITGDANLVQFATVGLKGRTVSSGPVTLSGLIGWRRGFGDLALEGVNLLNNREGFTVRGADLSKNAAVIEAGAHWRVSDRATLDAGYDGVIGDEGADHTARVGLTLSF